MLRGLILLLSVLAVTAGPAGATLPTGNVIVNGDAEDGNATADYFVTRTPSGWTPSPSGITEVAYDAVPPMPKLSGGAGNTAYFIGGNGSTTREMTQVIDLSAGAAELDGGKVYATLSGELGGWDSQPDRAIVTAAFRDASDQTIRTVTLPTVTSSDRAGVTKLLARSTTELVPAGTRSVRMTVQFLFVTSGGHTYNDASADNLALVLTDGADQLILNPGAEIGQAGSDASTRFAPPLWISTVGATQHAYAGAGYPDSTVSDAIGGGGAFFAGGSANPVSTMVQQISLRPADFTAIAGGNAQATLSAHLGGYAAEQDHANVSLQWWQRGTPGGDDHILTTVALPTVTPADRGNITTLLPRSVTASIPAATDYGMLQVELVRQPAVDSLAYNDAYVDNLALTITSAPDTQVDSGPQGPTTDSTPSWTFSSGTGTSFECRIDLGAFAACTGGDTFGPLADGPHTFEVRASDATQTDPTPARVDFEVDTVPAVTAIQTDPVSGAHPTQVALLVSASDPEPSPGVGPGFQIRCVLDPASAPATYDDLPLTPCPFLMGGTVTTAGAHQIYAATRDTAGNVSDVVARTIYVDGDAPVASIDVTPAGGTSTTSVTLTASATDALSGVAELRCVLDPASTPASFADLPVSCAYATATAVSAPGPHTLFAAARDGAGNASTVVSQAIAITPLPDTTIDSGPTGTTANTTPTFTFSSDDAAATFTCALDGEAATTCTSPFTTPPLPDGPHTLTVTAVNATGSDPTPASRSFTVDTTAPETTPPATKINLVPVGGAAPGDSTYFDRVTLLVSADDADGSGVQETRCALDPPSPPASFADLPASCPFLALADVAGLGAHTLYAAARDKAGNTGPLVTRTFTIVAAPAPAPTPPLNVQPRVQLVEAPSRAVLGDSVTMYAGGGEISANTNFGWDLTGDGQTDLTCTGMPGVSFTAQQPGQTNVTVSASGGLGGAAVQALNTGGSRRAAFRQRGATLTSLALANVAQCLPPRPGQKDHFEELNPCYRTQFTSTEAKAVGAFFVRGCLKQGHSLSDVPAAERGAVKAALDDWLRRDNHASTTIGGNPLVPGGSTKRTYSDTDYEQASKAMTWFIGEFAEIEGTQFQARAGHKIVVFPQLARVITSGADLSVGEIALDGPAAFSLNLSPKRGEVVLGNFKVVSRKLFYNGTTQDSRTAIAGLRFNGVMGVTIRHGGTSLDGSVELPRPGFSLANGPDGADVHLDVRRIGDVFTGLYRLDFVGTTIGPFASEFLGLGARNIRLQITDLKTLKVSGTVCLPDPLGCMDLAATFVDGVFNEARVFVNLPGKGIPLSAGVFLNGFGGFFGLDPTRMGGEARVTALEIFNITGKIVVAFPSKAQPYRLGPADLDVPANLYRTYTALTVGASGKAALQLPFGLGSVDFAYAYFLYRAPAYVALGGGVDVNKFGVHLWGGVNGEFNAENGRFNLFGNINASLFDIVTAGAIAGVSSGGAGGCVDVGPVNIGGGVQWRRGGAELFLWPFDGCKWSRFTQDNVVGEPSEFRAAGGARTLVVKKGDPDPAVQISSASGAPGVQITGPGVDVASAAGAGVQGTEKVRILRSEQLHMTTVGIVDAAPGTYTLAPLADSPPFTSVLHAADPPDARVSATVTGSGVQRTLTYDVLDRPGQSVTFLDAGEGGVKEIRTISGGGRGSFRFRPVPGAGRHQVIARFTLNGLPAERRTVARFTPPSPLLPALRGLKVRRVSAKVAQLSWRTVSGASSYRVALALGNGGRLRRTVRRTSLRASAAGLAYGAVVRVTPQAPMLEGRPSTAKLKTTKLPRPERFAKLA